MLPPLPVIPGTPDPVTLAQYPALAAGTTVGGNFERFKDLAEQGALPDSQFGYGQYLLYNSQGSAIHSNRPEFFGYTLAANLAYAVVNKMHVGNVTSPLYDPVSATATATRSIAGAKQNHAWTQMQVDEAVTAFNDHFSRLLQKWGYTGSAPATPAVVVATVPSPASASAQIPVDQIASDTVDANGIRTVVFTDGRRITGYVQRDGSVTPGPFPPAAQAIPGVQLLIDHSKSPDGGLSYETVAWRLVTFTAPGIWQNVGPWVSWKSGLAGRGGNIGAVPNVHILNVSDVLYEAQNYQGVPGRIAPMWDLPSLRAAIAATGPGTPPDGNAATWLAPAIVTPADPTGPTVKDWTDIPVENPPEQIDAPTGSGTGGGTGGPTVTTIRDDRPAVDVGGSGGGGGGGEPMDGQPVTDRTVAGALGLPGWLLAGALLFAVVVLSRQRKS